MRRAPHDPLVENCAGGFRGPWGQTRGIAAEPPGESGLSKARRGLERRREEPAEQLLLATASTCPVEGKLWRFWPTISARGAHGSRIGRGQKGWIIQIPLLPRRACRECTQRAPPRRRSRGRRDRETHRKWQNPMSSTLSPPPNPLLRRMPWC